MATTAHDAGIVTLFDLAKLTGPDGKILRVAELMTKNSPFLEDVHWQQGNLTTGHRIAQRTALPSLGWRGLNEGVAASKSLEDTVDETCGLVEGRSEVDIKMLELNGGDPFRAKKDQAFTIAMANEIESGFFYHSTKTAPKKFMGLTPRLDAFSGIPFVSQIIKANLITPSGNDQNSAWFVGWGEDKVYGIVPKGTQAGLQHEDMGKQLVEDANGNKYIAKVSVFNQWVGLCVEDGRYVVRVPNIDSSAIARTGSLLIQLLTEGYHQIQDHRRCRCVLYVNRFVYKYLHHQILAGTSGGTLTMESIENGRPQMYFLGIPVRMTEALLETEAVVS